MKLKLFAISASHYAKLIFRSLLFLSALVIYIIDRIKNAGTLFFGAEDSYILLGVIWLVFFVEMLLRFFPSATESMGCQKQFKKNYKPKGIELCEKHSASRTFLSAFLWLFLNGVIAVLYLTSLIDAGIMVLISLFYSVCDMVCILFFCPFQTFILKNKCCTTCRIYNWDYAMMFTPLFFVLNPFTLSLAALSLLLLLRWEITYRRHREYFFESTNASLSCANCKEKLCHHKRQLRHFLRVNAKKLKLYGNSVLKGNKKSQD